jgi:hypothetical protein
VLIESLNDITVELLKEVSPQSNMLKYFIKFPMLLTISTAALQSGLTIVFLKLITELGESGEFFDHKLLIFGMALCVGISGTVQLHMLNLAMKYYDQIEAIPVYQTSVMIMWILTGLIVFDEVKFYSALELCGIAGSLTLCCIGIKFLTMKTKMLKEAKREERLLSANKINQELEL